MFVTMKASSPALRIDTSWDPHVRKSGRFWALVFAVAHGTGTVDVYNYAQRTPLNQINPHDSSVIDMEMSDDGLTLFTLDSTHMKRIQLSNGAWTQQELPLRGRCMDLAGAKIAVAMISLLL